MYALENLGWRIKQIHNSYYLGKYDYLIEQSQHLPHGTILIHKTLKEVIEFISVTFLTNVKFIEAVAGRRMYSFKHSWEQEEFAEFWDAHIHCAKGEDGTWTAIIF